MVETHKLVGEIDAFLIASGMAPTTFGRKAVNDGKLVGRLRAGGSVTLEKASQIRRFLALPRPETSAPEPAGSQFDAGTPSAAGHCPDPDGSGPFVHPEQAELA